MGGVHLQGMANYRRGPFTCMVVVSCERWTSIYRRCLEIVISLWHIQSCSFLLPLSSPQHCTGHVLCSILLNSTDLLRVDLQGVQVLLPHLLTALEIVLPRKDIQLRYDRIRLAICAKQTG